MALYNIFDIAGSSMSAQSVRLNTVASNLANADSVSNKESDVYRSRHPVFAAVMQAIDGDVSNSSYVPVRVEAIVESKTPARQEYNPDHPMANKEGYIFKTNVNSVEEMANMMAASRSYQNNVEVFNTSKQLLLKTLTMGK